MMRNLFFLVFSILCLTTTAQTRWTVATSDITFKIKNAGFKVDGSLKGLSAQILFDPTKLSESSIYASVETKTIDTGIGMRDKHIKKEEYFDVEKYPKITIKSVKFIDKGKNNYIGSFQLTIKSITKAIDIPFTFVENVNTGAFNGNFEINRQEYTVGGNSWTMSDNVIVNIKINATKGMGSK